MSGNCVYAYDEGTPADIYEAKLRRARKEHRCGECGDAIPAGDLYEYVSGLWEGEWGHFRTCARCLNIRADYFHGTAHGCMVDDFEYTFGFDYRDGLPADFAPCGNGDTP